MTSSALISAFFMTFLISLFLLHAQVKVPLLLGKIVVVGETSKDAAAYFLTGRLTAGARNVLLYKTLGL